MITEADEAELAYEAGRRFRHQQHIAELRHALAHFSGMPWEEAVIRYHEDKDFQDEMNMRRDNR